MSNCGYLLLVLHIVKCRRIEHQVEFERHRRETENVLREKISILAKADRLRNIDLMKTVVY